MFLPASENDMPTLRTLIREGARDGGFDAALAVDGIESKLFFENFQEVVVHRVWRRPRQGGGYLELPARVLMYYPASEAKASGFVAVRGIGKLGYELWLTAIDPSLRGQGIGRSMLTEFFTTPLGIKTTIAQCDNVAKGAGTCAAILQTLGFKIVRSGGYSMWLASPLFSPDIVEWIKRLPFTSI